MPRMQIYESIVGNPEVGPNGILGNASGNASEFVDFFQSTTQPTRTYVYDLVNPISAGI
jgi:hypothetical protein